MLRLFLLLPVLLCAFTSQSQEVGWRTFLDISTEMRYNETLAAKINYPVFNEKLKALEGKVIQVSGFLIPLEEEEEEFVVISAYPFSSCFFCGAAGIESVIQVFPKETGSYYNEKATFRGKLKLNKELDFLYYILEDAELIEEEE